MWIYYLSVWENIGILLKNILNGFYMWVKIGHTYVAHISIFDIWAKYYILHLAHILCAVLNPVPPLPNPGHVWPTCCMPVPDECQLCQMHAKSGPNLFADWESTDSFYFFYIDQM